MAVIASFSVPLYRGPAGRTVQHQAGIDINLHNGWILHRRSVRISGVGGAEAGTATFCVFRGDISSSFQGGHELANLLARQAELQLKVRVRDSIAKILHERFDVDFHLSAPRLADLPY